MTRTVLHLAQDSDTSGFFPQLAVWQDRNRFRMIFGTLRPMDPRVRAHMESHDVECLDCDCRTRSAYPLGLVRLIEFLRRQRIDILHTHLFDPSVVGLVAGRLARTPARVVTRHYSDYHTRIDRPLHVGLDRLCTRLSHRVIAVSQHTADHLVHREGAPLEKICIVHNGIDFDRVSISPGGPDRVRAELGLSGRRVVLMAARLHPEKGYEHLIRAVPAVAARVPDLTVLVAGSGPFEAQYRALAADKGCGDSIHFLGFRRDLPDLMAACHVLVLPSRAEAFGLVAAEALYLGVPVVASRVGGIPEIVDDGLDGLLVPPGDEDALAGALVRVLTEAPLHRRLAGAGREKIVARFSFETMVRQYESIYDDLPTPS
jgi:glycosyltransferase involved in cell wall biosynthesis